MELKWFEETFGGSQPGPCGIPGSTFILDPDPGKLFSKPGSGSKPGFAFLYTFAQTCSYFKKRSGNFMVIFSVFKKVRIFIRKLRKFSVIIITFGHF